jgi:hypothetical protein
MPAIIGLVGTTIGAILGFSGGLVLQLPLRLAHYSAAILFPGRIACWLRVCL